jgi:chromosome segregation ATPase
MRAKHSEIDLIAQQRTLLESERQNLMHKMQSNEEEINDNSEKYQKSEKQQTHLKDDIQKLSEDCNGLENVIEQIKANLQTSDEHVKHLDATLKEIQNKQEIVKVKKEEMFEKQRNLRNWLQENDPSRGQQFHV